MRKVRDPHWIQRIFSGKIEQETESLEVLADVLHGRIAAVELEFRGELRLNCGSETWSHSRRAQLQTVRIEVTTKPLEMTTDEHDVALQALFGEWRRHERRGRAGARWRDGRSEQGAAMDLHVS